ncbi:lipoate--protein ligase family protein [Candidatus Bathyarchaeota archaeon]|jgi:lipoate-protein ligase A|nr:lipoate--protein ligase family protein [Candidatus Bathyarchaeota archaeon]
MSGYSRGKKMKRAEYKIPGGKLVAVELELVQNELRDIKIYGDFFMHPEESIKDLESSLNHTNKKEIEQKINDFFKNKEINLVGIQPQDFTHVIRLALNN